MENDITRLVRRVGACPHCRNAWTVVEDAGGNLVTTGVRQLARPSELLGAILVCLDCGNGVDSEGKPVRRHH